MSKTTRRQFLKASSLAACGLLAGTGRRLSSGYALNEKLQLAVIGIAGRGAGNLGALAGLDESIVALCDVDQRHLGRVGEEFPKARRYQDFRRVLDDGDIDAVVVSTPDHTHAIITLSALRAGKHVYCEKPLAHTAEEVLTVQRVAREAKRATQMGTQIHAEANYRRVVELVQSGAIGAVREAHCWVGKNWGGGERPKETPPVPEYLDYDLWLGPAPGRPYHPIYLPGNWRRWWDFGGGTLADMGCHYLDLPFWALELGEPATIAARGSTPHPETASEWLIAEWEFPARGKSPPCKLVWYDSGKRPELPEAHDNPEVRAEIERWGNGVLFVGERGLLLADYGKHRLLPAASFEGFQAPDPHIPDSIGHHKEWIQACKGQGATLCNFDYSGTLSLAVILGNVAYRSGERLEWDSVRHRLKSPNEATRFLSTPARPGWELSAPRQLQRR